MNKKTLINFSIITLLMVLFIVSFITFSVVKRLERPAVISNEAQMRYETLHKVKAAQLEKISHYAWEDKDNGIVRLPIERAVELTLKDLGAQG